MLARFWKNAAQAPFKLWEPQKTAAIFPSALFMKMVYKPTRGWRGPVGQLGCAIRGSMAFIPQAARNVFVEALEAAG